jgi:hypothetical protein
MCVINATTSLRNWFLTPPRKSVAPSAKPRRSAERCPLSLFQAAESLRARQARPAEVAPPAAVPVAASKPFNAGLLKPKAQNREVRLQSVAPCPALSAPCGFRFTRPRPFWNKSQKTFPCIRGRISRVPSPIWPERRAPFRLFRWSGRPSFHRIHSDPFRSTRQY